jgi:phosphoribosyl 1,2-cyclic phosphodiesterase
VRARIWGCRGSLATPGAETLRYGGNTSCLEVTLDGAVLVFDAGTGARQLGAKLVEEQPEVLHLLLTHLHLDHLEGLGFFAPLRRRGTVVHIWGPPSPVRSLAERISRYLSPPLFPVQLSDLDATIHFHDVPDGDWELEGARISARHVIHLGPTVGYRVEHGGWSLAYLPDHEPALGVELAPGQSDWISGYELAHRADVLLHDAQYTEDEYAARIGWGHCVRAGDACPPALALPPRSDARGPGARAHARPSAGACRERRLSGAAARRRGDGGRARVRRQSVSACSSPAKVPPPIVRSACLPAASRSARSEVTSQ